VPDQPPSPLVLDPLRPSIRPPKKSPIARSPAGIGVDLHFHDLRHTGNTLAAASGASLRELMAHMGHSTPRAALIYQHARRASLYMPVAPRAENTEHPQRDWDRPSIRAAQRPPMGGVRVASA
jgi:integrase